MISTSAIGFIYSMVGAVVLMRAFSSDRLMLSHAGRYHNQGIEILKGIAEQRVDGRFGAAFLFVGFGFQMLPALGAQTAHAVQVLSLTLGAIALLYYMLMRDQIAANAAAEFAQGEPEPAPQATATSLPALIEAQPQPAAMPALPDLTTADEHS